jgi:hypothetical protein
MSVNLHDSSVPGHPQSRPTPAPLRVVARTLGGVGVVVIMAAYVAISPVITLLTGMAEILTEVRETLLRPRPFVGARHGFPFLDRPPVHHAERHDTPAVDPE